MRTYKQILTDSWDKVKAHRSHIGTAIAAGSVVGLGIVNPPLLGAAIAGGVASGLYLKRVHPTVAPPAVVPPPAATGGPIGPPPPAANPGANPDQAAARIERRLRKIKHP